MKFISAPTRDDKQLREELLPAVAMIKFWQLADSVSMRLGGEADDFDIDLGGKILEVVQALPGTRMLPMPTDARKKDLRGQSQVREVDGELRYISSEHHFRRSLPGGVSPGELLLHANDHLEFPRVIIEAIRKKQGKGYADTRILCVVFDGDYSFEEDKVIDNWIDGIRSQISDFDPFESVFLVERARLVAFQVYVQQ
ncbi:MAG: hypothetical protein AAF497_17575 [Planctomycetota bacterium]